MRQGKDMFGKWARNNHNNNMFWQVPLDIYRSGGITYGTSAAWLLITTLCLWMGRRRSRSNANLIREIGIWCLMPTKDTDVQEGTNH